jgi:ABC-type dipeptide/oligopeptide/nickel transport system ATPase component
VIVVSTELDEIRALSDRIAVMFEGRIVDILPANRVTKEQLGLLMAGSRPDDLPADDDDLSAEINVESVL